MIIGIPKEIKENEFRVSITPEGVMALKHAGHRVLIEKGAGEGSFIPDQGYKDAGAEILKDAKEVYGSADLVLKVKEPLPSEYGFFRQGLTIFTFHHLASHPSLARELIDKGVNALAYETIEEKDGSLPILRPMSEIAGSLAPQIAAHYLLRPYGGRGVLLGGSEGVEPGGVVILGAGVVGISALKISVGLGAEVTIIDAKEDRLKHVKGKFGHDCRALIANRQNIEESIRQCDMLIGAVHIPGARTPRVISRGMLPLMKKGSVIVDVSVDQGGCVETTRPTTHSDPTYEIDGILHYCVSNMPGAVPWTSTRALCRATLPYLLKIADLGLIEASKTYPAIQKGINIASGRVIHPRVKEALCL
jgi:alanine dehydrogenase